MVTVNRLSEVSTEEEETHILNVGFQIDIYVVIIVIVIMRRGAFDLQKYDFASTLLMHDIQFIYIARKDHTI